MSYSNSLLTKTITEDVLKARHCLEKVDLVANDLETTKFKQTARLLQALWRESKGLKIGSQPMKPTIDHPGRPLGSRIDLEVARHTGANFLSDVVLESVEDRIAHPQPQQTLDTNRLYCDLLSSMPMCFNLFGELKADLDLADKAVHDWWPDTPGTVTSVEFEWSPGRQIEGEFLENRSAFDVAFILDMGSEKKGVIGVETKYHEDCRPESCPNNKRIKRYAAVINAAGLMSQDAMESILGTDLQQIWLDHLLAVSMPLHPSGEWTWSKFVLVHPEGNPSYARAAERYCGLLSKTNTFAVNTIESLLSARVLPEKLASSFRERYLWSEEQL